MVATILLTTVTISHAMLSFGGARHSRPHRSRRTCHSYVASMEVDVSFGLLCAVHRSQVETLNHEPYLVVGMPHRSPEPGLGVDLEGCPI